MFDEILAFEKERNHRLQNIRADEELRTLSLEWMIKADAHKYTYNFEWMGVPIIKFPNDMIVFQELVWHLRPDLIIETGVAHGGSILYSASLLQLIGHGEVIGIDNDIRQHNRKRLEKLPIMERIELHEEDSLSPDLHKYLAKRTKDKKVLVVLDSMHTHQHVLGELDAYSSYVNVGSYIVLPDTFIELFPKGYYKNRPWDVGNNPMTALAEFLSKNKDFEVDTYFSEKAVISESINGYIKRSSRI